SFLRSDFFLTKSIAEQNRIDGGLFQTQGEAVQRQAHFHRVLYGLQDLVFKSSRPFIPKKTSAEVKARIGQGHRVAAGVPALKAFAETDRIRKPEFLNMTRSARNAAI